MTPRARVILTHLALGAATAALAFTAVTAATRIAARLIAGAG